METDAVWSHTSVNGKRLTWKQLYERTKEQLSKAQEVTTLVSDLDRCPHGRHVKDDCSGCQADGYDRNQGNPWLVQGSRIGTTLSGRAIVYVGYRTDSEALVTEAR